MRSYQQHCALAKALDVIGDRWALLIVRELLIRGACRYTDLKAGLPGIATNLLVERLKHLETSGVITREEAPPPVATSLFRLTPRGQELETIVQQLGVWGAPLLSKAAKSDEFRTHWLTLPVKHCLRDHAPEKPPIRIEVSVEGESLSIETSEGAVLVKPGAVTNPDAAISGPPALVTAVLLGKLTLAKGRAAGLKFTGDPEVLRRLQPLALT